MKFKTKHKCTSVLSLFLAFVLSVSVLAPTAAAVTGPRGEEASPPVLRSDKG